MHFFRLTHTEENKRRPKRAAQSNGMYFTIFMYSPTDGPCCVSYPTRGEALCLRPSVHRLHARPPVRTRDGVHDRG